MIDWVKLKDSPIKISTSPPPIPENNSGLYQFEIDDTYQKLLSAYQEDIKRKRIFSEEKKNKQLIVLELLENATIDKSSIHFLFYIS